MKDLGAELQIVKSNLNKARGAVTLERVARLEGDAIAYKNFAHGLQRLQVLERHYRTLNNQTRLNGFLARFKWLFTGK